MKKVLSLILVLCMIFALSSCSIRKQKIQDYQFMYDGMVDLWNLHSVSNQEDIFGFGEYLYNSYLILFPRETPSTLTDYYFSWFAGIDVDMYAIYFTCTLTDENYKGFCEGLANFEIQHEKEIYNPLYDEEHFSLPTYILQWSKVNQKYEVLEYIMLDDENHTVIFVYTMGLLDEIEDNSSYTVTPIEMKFLDYDLSIYRLLVDNDDTYSWLENQDVFEECVYDISFLDYLK